MPENATSQLIGIAIPTLRELRGATLACLSVTGTGEADAIDALREAGFAGGEAVYDAFEQWLGENHDVRGEVMSPLAPELTLEEFGERTAQYFRASGWGDVEFSPEHESGIAALQIRHCWEADDAGGADKPACHVTTGMLAAFFGRLAGYPVAVMESECCSSGADRCRFLLGNSEVMTFKWEQLG